MSPTPIPDWQLERFRLGELPASEQQEIAEAVERSQELRARLDALERSDERILAARPPGQVAAALTAHLDQRAGPPRTSRHRLAWAAAASAVLFGLWTLAPSRTDRPPAAGGGGDLTRIKGAQPQLLLFRWASPRPEPLRDGAVVHARDVIQLSYVAAGRRYGVVVSIDGHGSVTRHLPSDGAQAVELDPRGPVALASAFELDDAPDFERFYFVTSAEPFAASVVTDAAVAASASAGERLALPATLEQSTFLLRKDGRR